MAIPLYCSGGSDHHQQIRQPEHDVFSSDASIAMESGEDVWFVVRESRTYGFVRTVLGYPASYTSQ